MADEIRATPRNSLAALLSDAIQGGVGYMKSPQRTQQLQGLGRLIESTGIPYTAESLSYDPSGRGLFTGAGGLGGTTRMRPEALEAAMTVAPMAAPAFRGIQNVGRMAGEELAATMMGQRPGGLMSKVVPQPLFAVQPEQGLSQAIKLQSDSRRFSDTLNVPDMNKEYIQSSAESLAGQLRELGFKVDLQHSGSVMGPSSYLNVADPTTGRYLSQPFRLSNHSKGVYNSEKVIDLNSPDQFEKAIDFALKTRNQPVSASQKLIDERGLNTDEETLNYMTKVYKRAMSKEGSLSNSERKAVQFMDENGLTDVFQETSIPPVTIK